MNVFTDLDQVEARALALGCFVERYSSQDCGPWLGITPPGDRRCYALAKASLSIFERGGGHCYTVRAQHPETGAELVARAAVMADLLTQLRDGIPDDPVEGPAFEP